MTKYVDGIQMVKIYHFGPCEVQPLEHANHGIRENGNALLQIMQVGVSQKTDQVIITIDLWCMVQSSKSIE